MSQIAITVETDTEGLMQELVSTLSREQVKEFILSLDLMLSDYEFTQELISELQESLDREDGG